MIKFRLSYSRCNFLSHLFIYRNRLKSGGDMLPVLFASIETPEDRKFIESLYQEYHLLMFFTANKYFSNQADREDAVQTSLESLIKNVKTLRTLSRCALASYIVTTIRNTCYNQLKYNKRISEHNVQLYDNPEVDGLFGTLSTDEMLSLFHNRNVLAWIWDRLSEEERFLLEGKYIMGYSDAELSNYLKCSPGSIRMKLTRTRRKALKLSANKEALEDEQAR